MAGACEREARSFSGSKGKSACTSAVSRGTGRDVVFISKNCDKQPKVGKGGSGLSHYQVGNLAFWGVGGRVSKPSEKKWRRGKDVVGQNSGGDWIMWSVRDRRTRGKHVNGGKWGVLRKRNLEFSKSRGAIYALLILPRRTRGKGGHWKVELHRVGRARVTLATCGALVMSAPPRHMMIHAVRIQVDWRCGSGTGYCADESTRGIRPGLLVDGVQSTSMGKGK